MRGRILVAEDSATQAEVLMALLEEAGHRPSLARSGEEALEALAPGGFDLVLSDVMMPGMTGYELCRRVKADPELRTVPMVLLTSLGDPMDIVRGLEAGADNYITKPYEAEHLLARVSHVLNNRRLRRDYKTSMGVTVNFLGSDLTITSDREQILDLLLSSVEDVIRTNRALEESRRSLEAAHEQLHAFAQERAREARTSTERYHAVMEKARNAIFVLEPDGTVAEANPRAAELLGRPMDRLLRAPLADWLVSEQRERFAAALAGVRAGGDMDGEEYALGGPDGAVVHCEVAASHAVVGSEEMLLVVLHDVTARKEAEQRLEDSEERYRSLFQYNPDAVFSLDPEGRFTSVNPACGRITGYTHEELLGQAFEPLLVSEDRQAVMGRFSTALGGEPQSFPAAVRNRGGERVELSVTLIPIVVNGGITGVFGIAEDVTEHRRALAALRRSEETFRTLVEASPAGIVLLDADRKVRLWNGAAERIFGWTAAELAGHPLPIFGTAEEEAAQATLERLMHGEPVQGERERARKDGTRVVVHLAASPLRGPDGEVTGIVGVMTDVTERRRSEEALRRSEEQLRQSQKMEAIGQLAGGIAHDFNNLLTVIKGNTQLVLADVPEEDPLREDLMEIDQSVDRAANLTRQLLTFSRKQLIQPRVLSLNEVVSNTDRLLRRVLGEHITLETFLDPEACCIEADQGQLEQVLLNLAVNARDAMPEGGGLVIETARVVLDPTEAKGLAASPGPYVRLSVGDTGEGMTPEVQSRIFEPFFTTKPQGKGTGLGLSTVYGIVQQSGGRIRVRSAPGAGTTFEIFFPRVGGSPDGSEPSVPGEAAAPCGTVLLVEDEPSVRAITRRMLERAGHTVHAADSGEAALRFLAEHGGRLDLMITDVVMPGLSGRELASRARERFPGMRVLFMSGYTEEAIAHHGALDPDAELIQKPFAPQALARRVGELLRPGGRG